MIADETSTHVEFVDAVREELKFELIVLHGEVKKLDVSWDFTAVVDPLLADQVRVQRCFSLRELKSRLNG
jgi:hypothetical protein